MPKTTKSGKVRTEELPSTLQRSNEHAQATYAKTLDSAEEQYGDGARAHQTAWAAVKHTQEKVGDHWEPKQEYGPSDAQAEGGGRHQPGEQGRGGRQRVQTAPVRVGPAGRHPGPFEDDQGRTGRRVTQVQRPGDGASPGAVGCRMAAADLVVRPVEPGDRDGWATLFRSYREFYRLSPDEDVVDRVWSWVLDPEHEIRALVAVDAGQELLGLAHLRRFARPSTGTIGMYLDDLFTRSDRRGSGVGRALIGAVAALGCADGCSLVRWITAEDNEVAQRLYDAVASRTSWVTYDLSCAESAVR